MHRASRSASPPRHQDRERRSQGLRPATTAKPLRFSVAATSCHPGRATLHQTLAVAPRRPASFQCSAACPSDTPLQAEIVRLRGVPINWVAGELPDDNRRTHGRASVELPVFASANRIERIDYPALATDE